MPITATTSLPDEDQPVLLNGVEDELTADRETQTTNYGSIRLQLRETGTSSWTSSATGFQETTVPYDDIQVVFQGLEDGEEYEVRARSETEHKTGAWTTPTSIVTKFPGVTQVSIKTTSTDSLTIEAQDNADNETGIRVYRRDELDPARDTGYTSYTQIAELDPQSGTFEYTDAGLDANHAYEYYFEPYTEHTSAASPTVVGTTDIEYSQYWTLELRRRDGDRLALDGDQLIERSINFQNHKPSTISTWSVDLPRTPIIEEWIDSEALWWLNGQLFERGPLHRHEGYEELSGKGLLWRLKHGGTSRSFNSIRGYKAVEDYIAEETEFDPDVETPSSNTIDDSKTVQDSDSGFGGFFSSIPDDVPLEISNDGSRLYQLQTCWTTEAEDYDNSAGVTGFDADSLSGVGTDPGAGRAAALEESGDFVEYTFTPQYRIPAEDFGIFARFYLPDGAVNAPDIKFSLNGEDLTESGGFSGGSTTSWTDIHGVSVWTAPSGDLQADTQHTLRIEATTTGSSFYGVDVVAPADTRFSYTLDNSVTTNANGNNYLDGPGWFPSTTATSDVHNDTYNIAEASLATAITGDLQGVVLEMTNDGGSNWYPQDGSEDATESVNVDFSTVGTNIQVRVTLDGYGSRTSTPAEKYQAQEVTDWELDITTSSLAVIDEKTTTGSHWANLKSLLDDAGMVMVPRMDPNDLVLEVFAPGDRTGTLELTDSLVHNHERVLDREGYANEVTVFGAEKPDESGRYQATASSTTEQADHGTVKGTPLFEPRLTSDTAVENQAARLLAELIAERDVTGRVEGIPELFAQVTPGVEYEISYGDFQGEGLILRSLSYSDLQNAQLNFEDGDDLPSVLAGLDLNLSQTKDAL